MSIPKHEIGNPLSVPVLDKTGEANPIQPFQIYLKNLFSKSGLPNLEAIDDTTLLYAFLGVSSGKSYHLEILDSAT